MQLTSTTDYAIRIISYLTEKNGSASANELSDEKIIIWLMQQKAWREVIH